jgi:hypothetical protein
LSFSVCVNSVNSAINQRSYLMKLLRTKGLNNFGLSVMFSSLILSKMLFTSQAFRVQLEDAYELDRLQRCLDKAFKWRFCV